MKREDMTVGMEVEYRRFHRGKWHPGKIIAIYDDEECQQVIVKQTGKFYYKIWRGYDEIRLPGTASHEATR